MPFPLQTNNKLTIVIVGAGLGGLTLATLLERAGVPYVVLEKSERIRPLGSAISMASSLMPLMEQLGLRKEILARSKIIGDAQIFDENFESAISRDFGAPVREKFEFDGAFIARPALYEILLSQIPPKKIHFNKRVITMVELPDSTVVGMVCVRCADDSVYSGDILVGADGAYSAIRKSLYGQLAKSDKGLMAASDLEPMTVSSICLVGTTGALPPKEYPGIEDATCKFGTVWIENASCAVATFALVNNTICWMALKLLDTPVLRDNPQLQAIEWDPSATDAMCKEVSPFPIAIGAGKKTLGDLIEATPRECISKVYLEEKMFETWYSGRTVLLGDACHKMNPSAGLGAVNAMLDAVALANKIVPLTTPTTPQAIDKAFRAYRKERYSLAKFAVDISALFRRLVSPGILNSLLRLCVRFMPSWLWSLLVVRLVQYRPQATFLPQVEERIEGFDLYSFVPCVL